MATTNFYFGQIHFVQTGVDDFSSETPDDVIERRREKLYEFTELSDVIYVEPLDSGEEAVWRFGECRKENGTIVGKLGKIFTEEQTQWDEEKEDYVKEREQVEVADVSHFAIFPELSGIAFNRKLRIGPNQFRRAFVEGYNNHESTSGKIDMTVLRTGGDKTFEEIIEIADSVREVEFELEPTNPYPEDDMEILDDHIRAMNADKFGMSAEISENQEDVPEDDGSLNPEEDFIRSGAALSEGGYGEYELGFVTKDGEVRIYNSRGERASFELPEPETIGGIIPHIEQLAERIRELTTEASEEGPEPDSEEDSEPEN